jgi:hypothetical protein
MLPDVGASGAAIRLAREGRASFPKQTASSFFAGKPCSYKELNTRLKI